MEKGKVAFYERVSERPFFDIYRGLYRLSAFGCGILLTITFSILNIIFKEHCFHLGVMNLLFQTFVLSGLIIFTISGFFYSRIISIIAVCYVLINVIHLILMSIAIVCCPCILFLCFVTIAEISGFQWRKRFDAKIPKLNQNADPVFFDTNDFTESEMTTSFQQDFQQED
jgi:MFS family permease